jgi:hypothetical protein
MRGREGITQLAYVPIRNSQLAFLLLTTSKLLYLSESDH